MVTGTVPRKRIRYTKNCHWIDFIHVYYLSNHVFSIFFTTEENAGRSLPLVLLALISYFARFLLFSFIKSCWLALPIKLFESTGFALFWAAAVEFVHKHASKDVSTTVFNITIVIYYNISSTIAYVVGGEIYQYHGGRRLFQIMASTCGLWFAVMIIWLFCSMSKKIKNSRDNISKTGKPDYLIPKS